MLTTYTIILLAFSITVLNGCMASSAQITTTEDMAYLTPIPQETLLAYRSETPITNKLQAVIAARINLAATRLHYATRTYFHTPATQSRLCLCIVGCE